MNDVANPYRPGEPVADPAMLFGRQDVVDWIERQITGNVRTLILSGLPLIGKTSFVKHVGALQSLPAFNLLVSLSVPLATEDIDKHPPARAKETGPVTINAVLQSVIDQLIPQLTYFNLVVPEQIDTPAQIASALRALFAQAHERLGPERLVLYFDDLHLLLSDDMALMASFLTSLMPLLDECPQLHLVFTLNQDSLQWIKHPLLDGVPTFNLGPLATDASLSMVTLPVKNILRFDYGVTKRIVEVNSNHPYYLSLFCHTLLNRQAQDGWVNQRDFDAALAEILDSSIEPFQEIWEQSSRVERAVLTGMAGMQGRHGPVTHQEIIRFLQRQNNAVIPDVVVDSLETLAERGVLVPMGAVSYRFHVELLRFWLREQANLAEILKEVDWNRVAAQAKPKSDKVPARPISGQPQRKEAPSPRRKGGCLWPMVIILAVGLCLLAGGAVIGSQFLDLPLLFLAQPTATPTATPKTVAPGPTQATATAPAEPTPTVTPTPPLVVARTLPSITYMGKDVDQSWRIYVMNADGSDVTPLSPEDAEDTAPTWSPDGQKIAFVSQRDGNREIYVMDADGQNVVNVTRHPADDWTPAWSPDGSQLAFASIRTGGWEIFVIDTACLSAPETCPDNLTQITADDSGNISPVWSPDGSRFAFNSKMSGNWDIYTMATDGSDIRQVTTTPENDLAPAWSPDGSQIAFETNRDGNVEIYVLDANGGEARNVTNLSLANDHGPTWSPDGQQLVFYSNREGNWDIFSTTLDGEFVINLTQTPGRDEQTPAWRP